MGSSMADCLHLRRRQTMQVYIVGNWHAEAVEEFEEEEVYITYDGWLEYESIGFWLCNGFTLWQFTC